MSNTVTLLLERRKAEMGGRAIAALRALMIAIVLACSACETGPSSVCVPKRDANGRIARNAAARRAFMEMTGHPNGRLGYVVDHIIPLACCGPDAPANMQWQTVADALAKDLIERKECNR